MEAWFIVAVVAGLAGLALVTAAMAAVVNDCRVNYRLWGLQIKSDAERDAALKDTAATLQAFDARLTTLYQSQYEIESRLHPNIRNIKLTACQNEKAEKLSPIT